MEEHTKPPRQIVIGSSNVLVTVGTLCMIVSGVVWVTRLDGRVNNVESGITQGFALQKETIDKVNSNVELLRRQVQESQDGYVKRDMLSLWLDLLRAKNPSMDVPSFPERVR